MRDQDVAYLIGCDADTGESGSQSWCSGHSLPIPSEGPPPGRFRIVEAGIYKNRDAIQTDVDDVKTNFYAAVLPGAVDRLDSIPISISYLQRPEPTALANS